MFYEVIPTKIFRQNSGVLTYSSDLPLQPGHLVRIPLGRTTVNGIVLRQAPPVNFPTKPIEKLLYSRPIPPHLLKSLLWLADYYLSPLPAVASLILPIGIEKTRRKGVSGGFSGISLGNPQSRGEADSGNIFDGRCEPAGRAVRSCPVKTGAVTNQAEKILLNRQTPRNDGREERPGKILLNSHQKAALSHLHSLPSPTKLLHGITGSGKTNIYLSLAAETLAKNQSVILLVPEISLTSQLVQSFCSNLGRPVTLIHSRQTESERHQIWAKLLDSDQPEIVIGPRSALFAPLHNLGLIIVDEAHESTYYQENSPRYHALRLASFIASTQKISCVLGSATPLVSDYYLAHTKKSLVTLDQKAKTSAITPSIHLVDLSNRSNFRKNRYFSDQLLAAITRNLSSHHQTLIFHNRRGSAPLTICEKCGWQALCPTCFLPLTLHSDTFELTCHTCGFRISLPHSCPDCSHPSIVHKGFGTKLLETELKKLFKTAKIARFDADNKKQETLDHLYGEIKSGDFQIIIGTQTVAKGLDLPHLATVGIVQADAGLSLPDYIAEERSFELITQVIGRVGRGHLDTAEVFIQTYQPSHPAIANAITADYQKFADYLLGKRREAHLPPYTYLARLTVSFKTESTTITKIRAAHHAIEQHIQHSAPAYFQLTPPTPAFHEQNSSGFTWQFLLKSSSRTALLAALKTLPGELAATVKITLDPPSLL